MKTAFCFDLDGTLTRSEILPILSKEVGLYEEMHALTEATIKGLIPFRRSFLLRCRLLSDIPISRVQSVISDIPLNRDLVEFIKNNKEDCYVITGNLDAWVAPLMSRLECKCFHSIAEFEGDKLLKVAHVLNKGDAMKEIKNRYDRIIVVGDGMGDVPMFELGDICVAFGGVHRPIETLIKMSHYITFNERALCRLLNTL